MPSLHEKCRYGKVFSVFVPKLRNKKKRCFALPQIAFAKGKKRKKPLANASGFMVPAAGVEPARPWRQQILSLSSLPIPSRRHGHFSL